MYITRYLSIQEREKAAKLFKGKKGAQLARELGKRNLKTFVPGAGLPEKKAKPAAAAAGKAAEVERTNGEVAQPRPDVEAIKVIGLVTWWPWRGLLSWYPLIFVYLENDDRWMMIENLEFKLQLHIPGMYM